jgi:ABC-type lipoprotein release transport system permease subunit
VSAAMGAVIRSPAMPYQLTWQTLAFTAVTTLVVTVCSSILSGIKVMRLEPAMVFNT